MARDIAKSNHAIAEAWKMEKKLVKKGMGTRDWTPDQQKDILTTGKVHDDDGKAFEGHHMKCVSRYPDFQEKPENIQFLSRDEHLKAHGGKTQNPTNGYYDYSLEKTTVTFDEDTLIPIVPKPLTKLADEVKEIMAKSEQPIVEAKEEQDDNGKVNKTSDGVTTGPGLNGNSGGQTTPTVKQTLPTEREQSNDDDKAIRRSEKKPHDESQSKKKGFLARLGGAIRDKHRELLWREFYDEYDGYFDDPVEKYEASREYLDEHEGDSILKCSFHILQYGKRTYIDPILKDPNFQNAIDTAVSLRVQRKLSGIVSGSEATSEDKVKINKQRGKTSSSNGVVIPDAPKPDVPKPDILPTPDISTSEKGSSKGTPKSPHPRKGGEGLRRKRNEDGDVVWQKVPIKPAFIHPEKVKKESTDDD